MNGDNLSRALDTMRRHATYYPSSATLLHFNIGMALGRAVEARYSGNPNVALEGWQFAYISNVAHQLLRGNKV